MKKILFVWAHHDDVELACLWTILKLKDLWFDIQVLVVTDSWYKDDLRWHIRKTGDALRESEEMERCIWVKYVRLNMRPLSLQVGETLINNIQKVVIDFEPDILFTHTDRDVHEDHVAVAKSCFIAWKYVKSILTYQSNNYISVSLPFSPNCFINVDKQMKTKKQLLQIYESEWEKMRRWISNMDVAAKHYWNIIGCDYAESFYSNKLYYA